MGALQDEKLGAVFINKDDPLPVAIHEDDLTQFLHLRDHQFKINPFGLELPEQGIKVAQYTWHFHV